MIYVIIAICCIVAIILAFMAGFNFAIKRRANEMLEQMNMGTIILDISSDATETFQCVFDKNPREMLNKDFILMEVKIRR